MDDGQMMDKDGRRTDDGQDIMHCYHEECLYPRVFGFLYQSEDEGCDSLRRRHFFLLDLSFSAPIALIRSWKDLPHTPSEFV